MSLSATKNLPENYTLHTTLNLAEKKFIILLNLIAIGAIFPLINLFNNLIRILRPDLKTDNPTAIDLSIANTISILAAVFAAILIHELIHGVFFWYYTQEIPEFAIKGLYAYAAAPMWYIPKVNFIMIGLSPVILITSIIIILVIVSSPDSIKYFAIAGVFNVAGSLGDFIVVAWIVIQPNDSLFRDSGDAFSVYHRYRG